VLSGYRVFSLKQAIFSPLERRAPTVPMAADGARTSRATTIPVKATILEAEENVQDITFEHKWVETCVYKVFRTDTRSRCGAYLHRTWPITSRPYIQRPGILPVREIEWIWRRALAATGKPSCCILTRSLECALGDRDRRNMQHTAATFGEDQPKAHRHSSEHVGKVAKMRNAVLCGVRVRGGLG